MNRKKAIIYNCVTVDGRHIDVETAYREFANQFIAETSDQDGVQETIIYDDLEGSYPVEGSLNTSDAGDRIPPEIVSGDDAREMESHMPFIPESVYKRLPLPLKKLCPSFTNPRERDVFLTSLLGVLSGCFDNVSGEYAGDRVHANLYLFIVAPAGSGKGSMVWAKRFVDPLNRVWKEIYRQRGEESKNLLIPANSSAASFIELLNRNGGIGIMIETEADTLAISLHQDWGNYSDVLRKGFHHEAISLSRKKLEEFIEIDHPRISIVLTGTPGQVVGIIPSAENGLFSRFIFYSFAGMDKWRNVSPDGQSTDKTKLFAEIGEWFAEQAVEFAKRQIRFDLTKDQWAELNKVYGELLKKTQIDLGPETQGIVKRSGLIVFRLAMVLSATRRLVQKHRWQEDIICNEADFRSAIELAEVYFQHSINEYVSLPKKERPGLNDSQRLFLSTLPEGKLFTRSEAVQFGLKVGFSESSVDKFLAALYKGGYLMKEKVSGEARKYRKN